MKEASALVDSLQDLPIAIEEEMSTFERLLIDLASELEPRTQSQLLLQS